MTFRESVLLTIVLLPMLIIIAMQVWLVFYGESGTLLLPGLGRLPSIDISGPKQGASTLSPVVDLAVEAADSTSRKAA